MGSSKDVRLARRVLALLAFAGGPLMGCAAETDPAAKAPGGAGDGHGIRGGLLYDRFWAQLGTEAPTGEHPLWSARQQGLPPVEDPSETWRCVSCHGWNYRGGSGPSRTGFKGIADTTLTVSEIVELLADADGHGYADYLDAEALTDLALFVSEWTKLQPLATDGHGQFLGDVEQGQAMFFGTCAPCHGADGLKTMVPGGSDEFERFPGLIANRSPQVFVHKLRFGQPGTGMPGQAAGNNAETLIDLAAYVQTLPQQLP